MPTVSIAMPVCNGARTLTAALRSIKGQTFGDWELILIDDGSTDGTIEVATHDADSRMRIISDGVQKGLAARLNEAVRMASGRYLARMDADDVSFPERLKRQVDYLEAHPEVDLLGTGAIIFDTMGKVRGLYSTTESHESICARPWAGFHLAHPTWMGKIGWFRAHPYDESATKAQDQVLLASAWRESRFACMPDILLGYRQDAYSWSKSLISRYHFVRGIIRASLEKRDFASALLSPVLSTGMLAFETVMLATGLSGLALRRRYKRASEADIACWQAVRSACPDVATE